MSAVEPGPETRRFRSTVPYYARYRLAYPPALIERVSGAVGLRPGDAVMDLGCGPGLLAIPFAERGARVVAIDPEPAMLEAARNAAAAEDVAIDFRLASSASLPADIGPFKLAAMGRSFHWMDRSETLRLLDALIVQGGAIALFDDTHPNTVENNWLSVLDEVASRFGVEEEIHRAARRRSDFRSHVSYLFDSAFSEIVRIGVYVRRAINADDIVGRAFSLSVLSHDKLGEWASVFEAELRAALAGLSADGRFIEIAEIGAVLATRK